MAQNLFDSEPTISHANNHHDHDVPVRPTLPPLSAAISHLSPSSSAVSSASKGFASPALSSSSSPSSSLHHAPVMTVAMDVDSSTAVDDRSRRATSVLSMDDIEAAQALEGLRSEFGSSPRSSTVTASGVVPSQQQPEPLLSLLTSTHPLISSAINGSMSAYSSSKSYSPRFKSGAEFIERTIGSPVVNTVGTVGRKTGVESGLRWALQRRESSSVAEADRSKRRRVDNFQGPEQADLERGLDEFLLPHRMRSSSDSSLLEPLPPYDELRSPQYEAPRAEHAAAAKNDGKNQAPGTWQSRLMISTSGLGVAMSEESLRSLQYCLAWLRWANGRIGKAVMALQDALKEWESHEAHNAEVGSPSAGVMTDDGAHTHSPNIRRDNKYNTLLSQRIQSIKEDVLSTLKQVVKIVSKYAGGALPENARNLVRRHLTSLPRRFQVASISRPPPDSSAATSDATVGAHRILVLAQEGLDMLAQVSGVVNDTLVSAEHWCARLGMKRPDEKNASEVQGPAALPATVGSFPPDVKQPVVLETCT